MTLKLTGTIADYNYGDQAPVFILDPTANALVPFEDVRDYVEDELRLRSSYELRPDTAVFFEGSVNERDYKQSVDSAGFRRGSSGTTLLAGAVVNFTNRLTGEISAGWGQQQSVDDRLSPVEGPLLNADLIWLPSPLTKLEFIARSEIDDTSLTDSLGAIDHYYDISLQHAFWRYLVLGSYVSYEVADYVDDPLVDQRLKTGLTAEYYFNPYASVYGRYEYTDFFSTIPSNDFIENELRLGFRIRH
ncbi:MAG: outer membrane beta-barrel protein [Methyloceanibacter sp.]